MPPKKFGPLEIISRHKDTTQFEISNKFLSLINCIYNFLHIFVRIYGSFKERGEKNIRRINEKRG